MSSPFGIIEEVRGGIFYDDPRPREHTSILDSVEAITSPLAWYNGGNVYINALLNPRIDFGAMVSVQGGTSYIFTGLDWRAPIYGPLFAEAEFGGAANDGARSTGTGRIDLGCPVTFRESGGLGFQLTPNIDIVASVEHVSHASLCSQQNPGLTSYGLRLGYRF